MTEITITCGFGSISGLSFREDIVKKGTDLLNSDHMGDVKEVRKSGKISILGRCVPEASIRKTPYPITLELNPSREVTLAHCSCQAGATGMYVPDRVSFMPRNIAILKPMQAFYESARFQYMLHLSKIGYASSSTLFVI